MRSNESRLQMESLEGRDMPATFNANAVFIGALYEDMLGRTAQTQEIAYWENQMNNGASRTQISAGIVGSQEYRENAVDSLYNDILRREADPVGRIGWVKYLETHSIGQAQAEFIGSQEYFLTQCSESNNNFLNHAYNDVLGRFADAQGGNFFLNQLSQGVSRAAVANSIVNSIEANTNLIDNVYLMYLNRDAAGDPGANDWVAQLSNGTSFQQVQIMITASDEYLANNMPITLV